MHNGPLTILQLTHHGEGAGSTQSIFSLSRALAARGHRVLVGCRPGTLLARLVQGEGLHLVPLDFSRLGPLASELTRVIAAERVAVVNSHDTRDRRALTWLRWRGRLPQAFVVTRRTMPLTSPPETLAIGLTADRTIAVSHAVARALVRRWQPRGPLRVVHNGIDLARVDRAPDAAELAAARQALGGAEQGRAVVVVVSRRKEQQVLLAQLPAVERPVALAFVGIAPDAELKALEARLPERHRLVYVPFTERPLAFYHLAAVAALPTNIEGFSQGLLEAMALGVPVVATAYGGNPELIADGETGLLVPPAAPAAWGDALNRLLGDRALAERLGRAGREVVRRDYTIERTAERTAAVYREAATLR